MDVQHKQIELAHSYIQSDVIPLIELVKSWGYGYITATKDRHHVEPQFKHLLKRYENSSTQVAEVNSNEKINMPILKTSIVGNEAELNKIEQFVHPTIPHLETTIMT